MKYFIFFVLFMLLYSNTIGTALQPCIVLKCGKYLASAISWFCTTSLSAGPVIRLNVCTQVFLPLRSYDIWICGLNDGLHHDHVIMIIHEFRLLFVYIWCTRCKTILALLLDWKVNLKITSIGSDFKRIFVIVCNTFKAHAGHYLVGCFAKIKKEKLWYMQF